MAARVREKKGVAVERGSLYKVGLGLEDDL